MREEDRITKRLKENMCWSGGDNDGVTKQLDAWSPRTEKPDHDVAMLRSLYKATAVPLSSTIALKLGCGLGHNRLVGIAIWID